MQSILRLNRSHLNYRGISNFNSGKNTLLSNFIRNDTATKDCLNYTWMGSRNFSKKSTKEPFSPNESRNIPKKSITKQDQLDRQIDTKSKPTLNLKFNRKSNQFDLKINAIKAATSSSGQQNSSVDKSVSGKDNSIQQDSEYCSICNAPKCKLISTEKKATAAQKSTGSDADRKSSGKDNLGQESSEYCPLCDAPTCRLEPSPSDVVEEVTMKEKPTAIDVDKKITVKENPTATNVDKKVSEKDSSSRQNDEYCSLCDAPRCRFQSTESDVDKKVSVKDNSTGSGVTNATGPDNSNMLTILVSKSEICGNICNDSAQLSPTLKEDPKNALQNMNKNPDSGTGIELDQKKVANTSEPDLIEIAIDKTELCARICNDKDTISSSPTSENVKKGNSSVVATNLKNTSSTSDSVMIAINKSEICRTICNQVDTVAQSSPTEEESSSKDNSKNKTKDGEYCSICNAPKCKLIQTESKISTEKPKKSIKNIDSEYSIDNPDRSKRP